MLKYGNNNTAYHGRYKNSTSMTRILCCLLNAMLGLLLPFFAKQALNRPIGSFINSSDTRGAHSCLTRLHAGFRSTEFMHYPSKSLPYMTYKQTPPPPPLFHTFYMILTKLKTGYSFKRHRQLYRRPELCLGGGGGGGRRERGNV